MGSDTPPTLVYLGLGANLGDRQAAIERALALLARVCGPLERSTIYETPPWGDPDQPPYLNLVVRGGTRLRPDELLQAAKEIERALGRRATRRWGPRVIDIDLLAYGDLVVQTPTLQVPHPRLHERGFVLVPLVELAPAWRHPVLHRTAAELLASLPPQETAGVTPWSGSHGRTRKPSPPPVEER
jgi:2-amino-4-hydroxy-6-hydroxymethyldihydropteridine diphosphokinase